MDTRNVLGAIAVTLLTVLLAGGCRLFTGRNAGAEGPGFGTASHSKARKIVSAWFPCDERGFDAVAPHADILASLSLFGTPSAEFMQTCRAHNILTYKLVGGDASAFDTPDRARATVNGYTRDCEQVGYDGIDLDFEHVDASFRDRYSAFVRLAAQELHKRGRRLSICVGPIALSENPQAAPSTFCDLKVISAACDEVRVMCYDMYYAKACLFGPTSTRPWARDVMQFYVRHVPREKLIMGLPGYSNEYRMMPGLGKGWQADCGAPRTEAGARQVERIWLERERINLYRYVDAEGNLLLRFASDADSTRAHLETVDELGLAGITFWHFTSTTPDIWDAVHGWLSAR